MESTNTYTSYAKIVPVQQLNDQLTLCKCYVLALGRNANGTNFEKETVDNALYSLSNIPVVGHLYQDENGDLRMGGHDFELIVESTSIKLKSLCVPFGVVPESHNAHYEDLDGETYLVCDVIMWFGRYPELKEAAYNDKTLFAQSMEIYIKDSADILDAKESYKNITDFQFRGLCLLGKYDEQEYDHQPCFSEARIDMYEKSDMYRETLNLFNTALQSYYSSLEGGVAMHNESTEQSNKGEDSVSENYSLLPSSNEKANALRRVLSDTCRWYLDHDENFVYFEERDTGTYRASYLYDNKTLTTIIDNNIEKVTMRFLTAEEISCEETMRVELNSLREYKRNREEKDEAEQKNSVFERFKDLNNIDEFKNLKKNMDKFTISDLEDRCFCIRGKNVVISPEKHSFARVPIGDFKDVEQNVYEEFNAYYGSKKLKGR